MVSYYNIVEGNLHTGDIAKSSDINHIQIHIQDMAREMNLDFHDGESYILGTGDKHKNDFVLTAAPKLLGRYIDDRILFEVDSNKYININRNDVKQPILLTKSSVYSIITKLKNSSNKDIPVKFELQDINGEVLRSNSLTIPKGTNDPREFEIVFDLDHYPTAPNMTYAKIMERDGKDIPPVTTEESYDEGFEHSHEDEEELEQFSVGVSQLYFVIKRTNLNAIDLADAGEAPVFNPDTSLGVFYTESSPNPEKNIYCQTNSGNSFVETGRNIWFKEVYANEQTYLCTGGEAVIGGEKVQCIDTHISIEGGNSYGNVVSHVYLGLDGHLYFRNTKASMSTNIDEFEEDLSSPMPAFFLPIAAILTYSNIFGIDKEPLVIQSQEYGQRPLSHHERLRRLEKQIDWHEEFAMPSRLKWTLTGEDWLDKNGEKLFDLADWQKNKDDPDNPQQKKYYITTDSQGNPIIKLSDSMVTNIPITLKDTFKDKDGKDISLAENDILNASAFASKKNMVLDNKKGTLKLETKKEDSGSNVAKNAKEAKETKFNPWDDYKGNRPASSKLKSNTRGFTVTKGKNGRHDYQSRYPAMTFYTKTNYRLTKLNIPIYKFKNCSGIKFFIWKRQSPNNKKNTVWLEKKIYTSKEFSLKKAKVKGKYQYMEKGFTIDFTKKYGKNGLSLPKGQYVIICLPIPKSGEGTVYVETYKPKNPKDFLIVYHGAANASHFLLKTRYPEIWYNSVEATAIEEQYDKKGVATSNKIVWNDTSLGKIETVKPVIGNNIKVPDKCSYKIFANTGANWQELTPNEDNTMNGGSSTFQWKIEFYSNGKDTPILKYDSKDKYALQFVLTRANLGATSTESSEKLDKNMCLTSVPFNANDILRSYVGDNNLALTRSPFTQFEFARVWAENVSNKKLLIDIQGSDRYVKDSTIPVWTYHYCDLTLDDFTKQNVDYSNYTEDVEYDENNLRLKLDSAHSYNDNDIAISAIKDFEKIANDIDSNTSTKEMTIVAKENVIKNQLMLKSSFDSYHDLTQYTGLKFKFKTGEIVEGNSLKINGLGIYISTEKDLAEVPTTKTVLTNLVTLKDTDVLPESLSPDDNQISKYKDQVIELVHDIDADNDGNKAAEHAFYKYVEEYDSDSNQMIYKLQQIHDLKSYNLYRVGEIDIDVSKIKTEERNKVDSEGNEVLDSNNNVVKEKYGYGEYIARIELDSDSQILKYAREIGIITMNDEADFSVTNEDGITLELVEVRGINEDCYPIYSPEDKLFKASDINADGNKVQIFDHGNLHLNETTFDKRYSNSSYSNITKSRETTPATTQVCIKYSDINFAAEPKLCYMNNSYGKLSHYKHLGVQIGSDVYIPKDALKINLCENPNGEGVFASVNLPTMNCLYNPSLPNNQVNKTINLGQVFKKINSDKEIKSISITATSHFKEFITETVDADKKDHINLFIGKIVLYKAETIPMFHETMRFKLYSATDGEIDHAESDVIKESINIRKLGTIIDYS